MGKHRVNGFGAPPKRLAPRTMWRGAEGLGRAFDQGYFDHVMYPTPSHATREEARAILMMPEPSNELRALARKITRQPVNDLTDREIEVWARTLAESVAGAND